MITVPHSTQQEYARRINCVLDYINDHLAEEMNLEMLAEIAMFSKYHFHRIFNAFLRETLTDYIRRIRLEKSANLLLFDRGKPVLDIALECGFSSQANFAKAFRKHFNITPSGMRASFDFRKIGKTERNNGKVSGKYFEQIAGVHSSVLQQPLYERIIAMHVEVKTLPTYTVAYARHLGAYSPTTIGPVYDKLCAWAGPRGLINEKAAFIGLSWDNPEITPPEKCRYDACITVPEDTAVTGDIGKMTIQGGEFAVLRTEIVNSNFQDPWNQLFMEWLPNSGYQPDDKPCMELYVKEEKSEAGSTMIVDLCLPVKPM